jgi:hypothetical protein
MDLQGLLTFPRYSWRRKRHEGDKARVDRNYLAFDYQELRVDEATHQLRN